jgi:hypothetical protein
LRESSHMAHDLKHTPAVLGGRTIDGGLAFRPGAKRALDGQMIRPDGSRAAMYGGRRIAGLE